VELAVSQHMNLQSVMRLSLLTVVLMVTLMIGLAGPLILPLCPGSAKTEPVAEAHQCCGTETQG